jgi:hypothetical protein
VRPAQAAGAHTRRRRSSGLGRGAAGEELGEVRRAFEAASADPYEAQAAWWRATSAVVEPLAASLTDEEAEDPDFVDPEIEQVHEDAAAA